MCALVEMKMTYSQSNLLFLETKKKIQEHKACVDLMFTASFDKCDRIGRISNEVGLELGLIMSRN